MQLGSPALPVGAFSYSQGLESAVEHGVIVDAESAERWINDQLEWVIARCDMPLTALLLQAWSVEDHARVRTLNDWFLASRESRELRLEAEQMGHSAQRWALSMPLGEDHQQRALAALAPCAYPAVFAYAAHVFTVQAEEAVAAFAYAWLENQVAAAIKCFPLGQTAGQRILLNAHARIAQFAAHAVETPFSELSTGAPMLGILSARHETQYSRLFRS